LALKKGNSRLAIVQVFHKNTNKFSIFYRSG
jgi:hypothetical protein